ncbi:hypothetical protein [Paraglaciecola sp.]|uniref:hypothetical protein n=1 Tax=Paraglaciecola sp. TaxID=1920173 RepID=UPI003EF58D44
MAGKKIWVTWLPDKENEAELQQTIKDLQMVGLEVSGAPWIDDLEKCAWTELTEMLSGEGCPDLWLVCGRSEDFTNARLTYGLSVSCSFLDFHNPALKMFVQNIEGTELPQLPTLLQGGEVLNNAAGWAAKVVAAAYGAPQATAKTDIHSTIIAHSAIGQWFEVGPAVGEAEWVGAMFGITGEDCEITFQAVGDRGQLPEKAVNEYPSSGIKAEIGDDEFTACALQNKISSEQSYYVKVKGFPQKIMFGGHPGTDQADVTIITLS